MKIGIVELRGMYIPTATGNAGTPASSSVMAISTPMTTSPHSRVPPRMPWMIDANNCGCGAEKPFGASSPLSIFVASRWIGKSVRYFGRPWSSTR